MPLKRFKLSEDLQVKRNGRYNKIGSFHTQDKTVSWSFVCWIPVLFCCVAPVTVDNLPLRVKAGRSVCMQGEG